MSNHFTGLSLGPPLGDQRLDLCDLYAFQSPKDPERTAMILNANPRTRSIPTRSIALTIDNDGDYLNDIAFSYVFSKPQNGQQTVNVFMAMGDDSHSTEAVGTKIFADVDVSFGPTPNIVKIRRLHVFRRHPQRRVLFRLRRHQESLRYRRQTEFHRASSRRQVPWTGKDSNTRGQHIFDSARTPDQPTRCASPRSASGDAAASVGKASCFTSIAPGPPSVSSFFNTDDTKLEYNASEPINDRTRWLDQFVHLMGHTGNYTREEAIAAIDKERTLPDMLSFDPSKPAAYPNGRVFTDDVINYRLAFLTKNDIRRRPHAAHRRPEGVPVSGHAAWQCVVEPERAADCARPALTRAKRSASSSKGARPRWRTRTY